ncbi:alpha/beta fold hydrolase [Palleronia sp. KMU-117]|uniref:alpha/beta fold hydrolase n=1 Tax=Palleronia sp. KMU-117 TaxID=3434108 RepID=UPI003D70F817
MTPAPFHGELAEGPPGGHALWLTADDGVRLRAAFWPSGSAGTVFVFPGRTEMVEKYGRLARDLAARGFSTVAIDWRGQGLADRVGRDPMMGHVGVFADYQRDWDAVLGAARTAGLPEPYFVIGHSMGGAIALRAVLRSAHPFAAAAFSAPMWGIRIAPHMRPVAWVLPRTARALGRAEVYSPGAQRNSYLASAAFEGNTLTTCPDQFAYMQRQVRHDERFALGGPSIHWLHEALTEIAAFRRIELPDLPVLTGLGSGDMVVDGGAVAALARRWPGSRFTVFDGARHELLMERAEVRGPFLEAAVELFESAA